MSAVSNGSRAGAPVRRLAVLTLSGTLALSVLTGCSETSPTGAADAAPRASSLAVPTLSGTPATPVVTDAVDLTLPIDDYLWSQDETETLHAAQDSLISACLEPLDLALPETPDVGDLAPESTTSRRYGVTSLPEAQAYGYRLPAVVEGSSVEPSAAPPDATVLAAITGTVRAVGDQPVPEGGCAGEADRSIGAGRPVGLADAAQDVNGGAWTASRSDPHVIAAFDAWSACMRDAGYDYPDPMAPMNDASFTGTPSDAEKDTATADVACKDTTNVTGTWYAYDVAYQLAMIAEHQEEFTSLLADKTAQLAASATLLAQR